MTDSVPPTLDHLSTPSEPRSPASFCWICWLIVLLSAGMVFVLNFEARGSRSAGKPDRIQPAAQELMTGRYAVGTRLLLGRLGSGASSQPAAAQLADEVVRAARTPAQRIRAAVVVAEVRGADSVTQLLDDVLRGDSGEDLADDARAIRGLVADRDTSLAISSRDRLIDRHGWFAELALSQHRPDVDPLRAQVLSSARRTAVGMMTAGIGIILVVGLGLVLGIVAVVLLATGTLTFAPSTAPSRHSILLESFTIYLVIMSLPMAYAMLDLPAARWVQAAGLLGSVALAIYWPIHRGMSWREFRESVGLTPGRGVATELFCGAVGYVALLPILAIGAAITIFLTKQTGTDASHPVVEALTGPLWQLVLVLVLATIWAPITEELMFRGAFYGHARSILTWPLAAIIVAIIFAAIHPQGWAGIPVLASIGFNLALLRQWRGTLVAPIAAHALNNGTALLIAVMLLR